MELLRPKLELRSLEATAGVEPAMGLLQSPALPLGYVAAAGRLDSPDHSAFLACVRILKMIRAISARRCRIHATARWLSPMFFDGDRCLTWGGLFHDQTVLWRSRERSTHRRTARSLSYSTRRSSLRGPPYRESSSCRACSG